jgi:type I restriction enzyme S subunit
MNRIAGWKPKTLTELANYINGFAFKPADWGKEGLPIIRIEQLKNPEAQADYFAGKLSSSRIIENGDLIFSWSASLFLRIWQHDRAALNQHLFKVIEVDGIDRGFLKAFIEFHLPALAAASHGSTMQHITRKELGRFVAPFPESEDEQAKIAEIISAVDRAIEQTEALIAKQERIKTGLMQDLLTCGIDEHDNLRSESTHEFKDSPFGRIPVGWNPVSLESVSEFVTSGSRGWARYYSTDGAIFLRIGNLTRRHINFRLDDLVFVSPPQSSEGKRTAVETGDLLISITADLGIIGIVPSDFDEAYVNQHIALVRLMKEEVSPRFIGWFLSSQGGQTQFESFNESGAKAGLNLPTIKRLIVPKMNPTEQERIAAILDSAAESIKDYERQLVKLRYSKAGLMQDLLTGKKRVTPLLQINADN